VRAGNRKGEQVIDPRQVRTVGLLKPCLARAAAPEVIIGATRALTRAGFQVRQVKGFTCCGQPALTAGRLEAAKRLGLHTIRVLAGQGVLVMPSASCVSTIRDDYARLFAEEPGRLESARELAGRVFELTEFLIAADRLDLGAEFSIKAAYHASCHLHRHLGVGDGPLELLKRVQELELVELDRADRCCGFGGQFAVDFPEISGSILADKLDCIERSSAEAVIVGDVGCKLNIAGGLGRRGRPVRTLHLAEVLGGGGS
jgi:L-lactate dehydrogenase complex protein LldE